MELIHLPDEHPAPGPLQHYTPLLLCASCGGPIHDAGEALVYWQGPDARAKDIRLAHNTDACTERWHRRPGWYWDTMDRWLGALVRGLGLTDFRPEPDDFRRPAERRVAR